MIANLDKRSARAYTCAVLEMVDDGVLDEKELIQSLLLWMSEHEVKQFCERNLSELFEEEETEE